MSNRIVRRDLGRNAKGVDVRQLQQGINRTARHWKLEDFEVAVDAAVGPQTLRAATKLLYAIGAHGKPLTRARDGILSEYAQRLLRGSRKRTKAMAALSQVRRPRVRKWRLTLRERAYRLAKAEVGVVEEGGNNRGERVELYITSNGGMIGEAWCGDFMAFVYRLAGSLAVTRSWAAVRLLRWVAGIKRTTEPEQGDIVTYDFDHTGMFDKWLNRATGEFLAIEGNTGDLGAVSDSVTGTDGVKEKVRNVSQVDEFLRVTR